MGVLEVFFIGIGLAMDAFAVAICKGLSMNRLDWKKALIIGLYFGFFQAIMPVLGYFLGATFTKLVLSIDHWIAFILLSVIGIDMIRNSFDDESSKSNDMVDFKTMLVLSIATSIDALAVGITFAFLKVNIIQAVVFIGVITFLMSLFGVYIGHKFGGKFENKAEILGGIVLIIIGLKILLEHLGFIL